MSRHNGIAGLEGIEPVGAVVSMGRKGPRGNPIEKDRLHILEPLPDANNVRHHHSRFGPFNKADIEYRRTIIGQIVHNSRDECFNYRLNAYTAKGQPSHPRKLPFCTGDGVKATRYMGLVDGEHTFNEIVCPHERCEFRQGDRPACKTWAKVLFRLVWQEPSNLPTCLAKFTTRGWRSTRALVGFFDQLDSMAAMVLGDGRAYSLGGITFTLTLSEQTNPEIRSRWPVATFAPLIDPIEFFSSQLDRIERVGSLLPAPEPVATLTHETPEDDAVDYQAHMPGHVDP